MQLPISSDQLWIVIGIAIAAIAGMLITSGSRNAEKRLRDRIGAVRDLFAKRQEVSEIVLLDEQRRSQIVFRVMHVLGYRPDLPPRYRPSLKIVFGVAGVLASLTFRLASSAVSTVPAVALAAVVLAGVTTFQFRRKNGAYKAALFKQIPDTMSLMLRAVRAGLPVAEAIRSVGRESLSPTREEFARVAAETALGAPVELTLRRLYGRTDIQEFAFFAVVIGLHGQTGGNLAETLENLADTVRRRVAMAAKARALAAEGRLSAMVVGGLPFVVAALISFMNPGYMMEFLADTTGKMLILAFALLLTVGMIVTHWLVQRSTRD